ncbi:unnamed protein product [Microthlaspi erraticum]|uniref:Uncharacterized protein n=1 Tax=Microthlaspi erraticum TaxID=1685480 RepID=A0A6D2HYE8_9BRAS|nr:unnamed protein product [Microthlaspi erraticum]
MFPPWIIARHLLKCSVLSLHYSIHLWCSRCRKLVSYALFIAELSHDLILKFSPMITAYALEASFLSDNLKSPNLETRHGVRFVTNEATQVYRE